MDRRIQTALRLLAAVGAIAAPALFAQMAVAQNAQAQGSTQAQLATALPLAPYASMDRSASYGGRQVYDRYGGGTIHPRVQAPLSASTYTGPRLAWAGKIDAAPAQGQTKPYGQAYAPARPSAQAAAHGWTFVPPIGASSPPSPQAAVTAQAPGPAPVPTSIYDPVPPAPQASYPVQAAQAATTAPVQARAASDGARRYSVHREFGQEPDPIPIPPQFFGATADLTQPETAEPQRRSVGADGKSRNVLQPTDGQ